MCIVMRMVRTFSWEVDGDRTIYLYRSLIPTAHQSGIEIWIRKKWKEENEKEKVTEMKGIDTECESKRFLQLKIRMCGHVNVRTSLSLRRDANKNNASRPVSSKGATLFVVKRFSVLWLWVALDFDGFDFNPGDFRPFSRICEASTHRKFWNSNEKVEYNIGTIKLKLKFRWTR